MALFSKRIDGIFFLNVVYLRYYKINLFVSIFRSILIIGIWNIYKSGKNTLRVNKCHWITPLYLIDLICYMLLDYKYISTVFIQISTWEYFMSIQFVISLSSCSLETLKGFKSLDIITLCTRTDNWTIYTFIFIRMFFFSFKRICSPKPIFPYTW